MRTLFSLITAFVVLFHLNIAQAAPLFSGDFTGVNGKKTRGEVTIKEKDGQKVLVLSKKFKTSFGPSLFVHVANGSGIGVALKKLKKRKGEQTYAIPASVKVGKGTRVLIYCKPFSVVFGSAKLK